MTRIDEFSKNEIVRNRIICGANLVAELQKHRSKEIAQDSCLLGSLQATRVEICSFSGLKIGYVVFQN